MIWNAGSHDLNKEMMECCLLSADKGTRAGEKENNFMHIFIKPELVKDLK